MDTASIDRTAVVGEMEKSAGCTCNHKASRGRVLCKEARELQTAMKSLVAAEQHARREHGPASAERKEIMERRLVARDAFHGHLRRAERFVA